MKTLFYFNLVISIIVIIGCFSGRMAIAGSKNHTSTIWQHQINQVHTQLTIIHFLTGDVLPLKYAS